MHIRPSLFFTSLPAILVVFCPHGVQAATLNSITASGFGLVIGPGVLPPELPLQFAFEAGSPAEGCFAPSASCIFLFDSDLTNSDIGSTLTFGPSDAGFTAAANLLTGTTENEWAFSAASNAGGDVSFGPIPPLTGDTITGIDLTINNLTFSQVQLSTGLSTVGTFTQAELDATVTILGTEAPEPRLTFIVAALFFLAPFLRRWCPTRDPE